MGEEIKDYECKGCGNSFASDEDSILSYGVYCDSCIKVCEMECELTALREENERLSKCLYSAQTIKQQADQHYQRLYSEGIDRLESEVKRYREALEKIFKLKVPEHKDCVAYDIASSALSEGGSE